MATLWKSKPRSATRQPCNRPVGGCIYPKPFAVPSSSTARPKQGSGIELPHWKYPVVANTETGQLRYDNYNGRWGSQEFLDQFLQMYAVETTKIEARRKGHSVVEQKLDNGSIKLTVNVGGAA